MISLLLIDGPISYTILFQSIYLEKMTSIQMNLHLSGSKIDQRIQNFRMKLIFVLMTGWLFSGS